MPLTAKVHSESDQPVASSHLHRCYPLDAALGCPVLEQLARCRPRAVDTENDGGEKALLILEPSAALPWSTVLAKGVELIA